ncbi:uncharacterized protein LOC121511006 [Cheilinus undulatus]|uniref:uncharacterized protein LOC121511006 n=1 Tax=Cheilinus undulatus TaxID=241271 RepID=UPI001BD25F73|nr:uncharacterized protein LOC121511006 [Cheilinus undulatus]
MSVALYSASGNNATLQSTTVGGTKPLHRFIKGQPKIIGIIVLILGSSSFILSISVISNSTLPMWSAIPPGILVGLMFIACGILYVLTEHNPTKKTVTISLALSIVAILGTCWTLLQMIPEIIHNAHYRYFEYMEENMTDNEDATWASHYEAMGLSCEVIFLIYSFFGGVIFVVMSVMAGAALRSTKSQALVMMTTTPSETRAEEHAHEEGLNCEKMSI